jgi:hypothetical protein
LLGENIFVTKACLLSYYIINDSVNGESTRLIAIVILIERSWL